MPLLHDASERNDEVNVMESNFGQLCMQFFKQNFDGDKNNSKIAGTVVNTFLNSGVFCINQNDIYR